MSHRRFDHVATIVPDLGQGDGVGRTPALRRGLRSGPIVHSERWALCAVAGALPGSEACTGMFVELVPHAHVALGTGTSGPNARGAGHQTTKSINTLGA
jgi:hypothetical protein